MHGEALTAAIDAWIEEAREEGEIKVESRRQVHGGELLVIAADANHWEMSEQEVSVIPPRNDRVRILFLGHGHSEQHGLHVIYYDLQSSMGEHVDVSDHHHIQIWFGLQPSPGATDEMRGKYEEDVRGGILEHLISADRLIAALSPAALGDHVLDRMIQINRRMA